MRARAKLDDRDLKILAILQREGRITKAALAERVNLSPTPCWERLKRLEKAGIIEGYGARINLRAFVDVTLVFVQVELEGHRSQDFQRFEDGVLNIPEVLECWGVGGGFDYLLKVIASSVEDYQRMVEIMLSADIGVQRYFTYVVTKSIKNAPLPMDKLTLLK